MEILISISFSELKENYSINILIGNNSILHKAESQEALF
ncbi:hypothetical protein SAMN05421768_101121 [Chryseobacterium joostei]|uniref:Uncharacterized protein n=1 Tax=Chryseobacterium joostei TaxID=112234 RepID=A0A1N7HSW4_9FLAO|nr:hypothetical protein SAMN05421768_101121 [Chryseobacterium joostei]